MDDLKVVIALIGGGIGVGIAVRAAVQSYKVQKEIDLRWKLLARQREELAIRGIRRTGRVRDVIPRMSQSGYSTLYPHMPGSGSPILYDEGVLLVVRIDLPRESGPPEVVTCDLIEDSEKGRARIGTEIAILQHPDNPDINAIEGYTVGGKRLA